MSSFDPGKLDAVVLGLMHHEGLYALRKVSHGDNWVDDHHGTLLLRKVSHGDNWDDHHHGTLLLRNNSGGEIDDIHITIVDLHHEIGDIHGTLLLSNNSGGEIDDIHITIVTIVDLHHEKREAVHGEGYGYG